MSEIENKNSEVEKTEETKKVEVKEKATSTEKKDCCTKTKNTNLPYIIIIILLVVIAILSFFAGKNYDWISQKVSQTINPSNIEVTIISDKRCWEKCWDIDSLVSQVKATPFFSWALVKNVDYNDAWVKDLVKENEIEALPAFLLNTNKISEPNFVKELKETKWGMFTLNIGWTFDPNWEICTNNVDDNNDWLVDCKDPKCGKELSCQAKVDKPVADLYIMSYCPYWLQAQKWYLEVMSKLSKVADVNIKWVQYTMHGKKEAQENIVQDCIQKEQKDKYTTYLNCFLAEEWKGEACRKEAKINEKKLSSCIDTTTKKYNVDLNSTEQTPAFNIDKEEALKVWVQWSPTFVLNGIKVENIWRSAKAYADAICSTFKNKPKECEQKFQDVNFDPMFGFTTWNWSASANSGCGQ